MCFKSSWVSAIGIRVDDTELGIKDVHGQFKSDKLHKHSDIESIAAEFEKLHGDCDIESIAAALDKLHGYCESEPGLNKHDTAPTEFGEA